MEKPEGKNRPAAYDHLAEIAVLVEYGNSNRITCARRVRFIYRGQTESPLSSLQNFQGGPSGKETSFFDYVGHLSAQDLLRKNSRVAAMGRIHVETDAVLVGYEYAVIKGIGNHLEVDAFIEENLKVVVYFAEEILNVRGLVSARLTEVFLYFLFYFLYC